ncbi:MAG: hypothetical protein K0Q95_3089 [Bacteroidota bacterium]|jgi:hypothetical protein|nr:hypothetical protein [Bacteroidota bacterium]
MSKLVFVIILSLLIASCSPQRFVKPLAKKEHAANLALGGPLIKYGESTIPIPFLTANYGYGIDSSLTAYAGLNITSALYGNFQLELGAVKQWIKQQKYLPAVSSGIQFNIIYRDKISRKLYPQLDLNLVWEYGKGKNYFYLGVSNWFELSKIRTLGQPQSNHWIFMPLLGHNFRGKKWDLSMECKVIAPNLSNEKIVVEYQTPLKNCGAFGVYLGYTRRF